MQSSGRLKLQPFVPSTSTDQCRVHDLLSKEPTSGDEISSFYESVVTTNHNSHKHHMQHATVNSTCNGKTARANKCSDPNKNNLSTVNAFLQYAQCGDIFKLRQCVEEGQINVNCTDGYGWTALMCAAFSGARNSVDYLLSRGANRNVCDCRGMSAVLLANKNGHGNIVQLLLEECRGSNVATEKCSAPLVTSAEEFHCEECSQTFTGTTRESHLVSTLHQFNTQRLTVPPTVYHISETNVGFQLMLKDGWDSQRGLGPTGSGARYPPKTILKRDRKGLGQQTKVKARITHFGPGDVSAVRGCREKKFRENHVSGKKLSSRKQLYQKKMEIAFRRQFNE